MERYKAAVLVGVLIGLIASFLFVANAYAAPIPYSDKVGAAVASLIAAKTSERVTGVAMNATASGVMAAGIANEVARPAYQTTVQAAGVALTALATTVATVAGAPFWAVAAVGTIGAVAIPIALNGAVEWLFNEDGKVTLSHDGVVVPVTDPALQDGYCYTAMGNENYGCAGSKEALATSSALCGPNGCSTTYTAYGETCTATRSFRYSSDTNKIQSSTHTSCSSGSWDSDWVDMYSITTKVGTPTAEPGTGEGGVPVTKTMAEAVAELPDAEKSLPANPEIVAAIANESWSRASATPGAIPYDPAHPITASDVMAWRAAGVATYPTVGDVFATAVNPATGSVSLPIPGAVTVPQTGAVTGTSTTGATTTNIKLSIDWGMFVAPDTTAPTIESILDPLFNMWPAWKNFAFPAHASQCPRPSFTLPQGVMNGQTLQFNQMCNFLDMSGTREAMQAAFTVAWAILIIFIVMGA